MEKIAFIWGSFFVPWSSVILILASLAAICIFLSAYLEKSGKTGAAFFSVPLAVLLSVAGARMLHWYCFEDTYSSFFSAMTDYTSGGFALAGVFAGCLLAATLTRFWGLHDNLPQMLDCMCLAGSAGIAGGRLASFFHSADRGQIVTSIRTMPWVYPVINRVSGAVEYRLAVFLYQAMLAGLLFVVLLLFFASGRKKPKKDGDAALVFLLIYGSSQVLFDSMRYDSLYFRSNGFVSIVQVLGALSLVLVMAVFSIRLVKVHGLHVSYFFRWAVMLVLTGLAGYMEYHVQRHGDQALFAYSVMGSCLILLIFLTLRIRRLSQRRPKRKLQELYLQ